MSEGVIDLERHRAQLVENISKLQKSLRYWQTWEAEYEGLKEEILGLGDRHTNEQLKRIGGEFGGELLNQKEINLLLQDARGHARSSQQILGLLERRVEYVQTNINSVKSLLQEAEAKAAASVAISQEVRNDDGLPLIEIREDLDDEGNVISTSITSPSDAASHVTETLRKSGVEELLDSQVQKLSDVMITDGDAASNEPAKDEGSGSDLAPEGAIKNIDSAVSKEDESTSVRRKKSVSFAKGTKEEDATTSKSRNIVNKEQKAKLAYLRKLLRPGMPAEEIVNKVSEDLERPSQNIRDPDQKETKGNFKNNGENPLIAPDSNLAPSRSVDMVANDESKGDGTNAREEAFSAIIPASDTAEEATLRQEMLQYQTAEVGPVVAQIDLDDDGSEIYTGEDDSAEWTDSDEANDSSIEDEEDEDQYGRTKHYLISDDYRQEMLALEAKLNAKSLQNIGPGGKNMTAVLNEKSSMDVNRSINTNAITSLERKISPTKEVRFATDAQIQDNKQHPPSITGSKKAQPSPSQQDPPSPQTQPSLSRFKAQRNKINNNSSSSLSPSTSPIIPKPTTGISAPSNNTTSSNPSLSAPPNPPTGITSATIIERPYKAATGTSQGPASAPAPPSSEDPALVHQQLTTEYHELRNRMIYRQGGFLADDDDDEEEQEEGEIGQAEARGELIGKEKVNINEKETLQNLAVQGDEGPPLQQKKISRFRAARLKGDY